MPAPVMLSAREEEKRLDLVYDYLRGYKIEEIKSRLTINGLTKREFKELKFFPHNKELLLEEQPGYALDPKIDRLFRELNITLSHEDKIARLKKANNLYDLLLQLRRKHNAYHLKKLITLIDNTHKLRDVPRWVAPVVTVGMLTTAIALVSHFAKDFFSKAVDFLKDSGIKALKGLKAFFAEAKNIAILGASIHAIIGLLKLVSLIRNKSKSTRQKVTSAVFTIVSAALNIGGFMASFAAAGIAGPVTAACFILSSVAMVIKESVSLHRHNGAFRRFNHNAEEGVHEKDNVEIARPKRAEYQRALSSVKQHRWTLGVKIFFALVSVAVVAVWTLFPPSLALTAGCIGALIAIISLQKAVVGFIKGRRQRALQHTLDKLPESSPEVSPSLGALHQYTLDRSEHEDTIELKHGTLRIQFPKEIQLKQEHDDRGDFLMLRRLPSNTASSLLESPMASDAHLLEHPPEEEKQRTLTRSTSRLSLP